jgi:6-phosphogluconolactonase
MTLPKNIIICPDILEMSRVAAEEILQWMEKDLSQASRFSIALSGGSTPRTLYRMLSEPPYRDRVLWEQAEFFFSDERCVPYGHPESNYQMVTENLFSRVMVPPQNIHRIYAELPDPNRAAADYENEIRKFVPLFNNLPRFNLMLLGMGEDGHTASLFPHSQALRETVRWVVFQPAGQPTHAPGLNGSPKTASGTTPALQADVKHSRITMTPPVINNAAFILFLVAGKSKARTLKRVFDGPFAPEELPAQMIRPTSGKILWITDQDAAAELRDLGE